MNLLCLVAYLTFAELGESERNNQPKSKSSGLQPNTYHLCFWSVVASDQLCTEFFRQRFPDRLQHVMTQSVFRQTYDRNFGLCGSVEELPFESWWWNRTGTMNNHEKTQQYNVCQRPCHDQAKKCAWDKGQNFVALPSKPKTWNWRRMASMAPLLSPRVTCHNDWCLQDKRCESLGKNKMKPTNPNADTYVEKRKFNTYLSQFPANPLVEHPDLTHWGDTLVGHPCLTLLRYALVRHSCLTLWFDTLAWHSSKTLLLDTLVRHFLLDTLTRHSCKTLLLDTLVEHFLLDTSYLALLTWHSSGTLLPDTLVRHSCLTDTLLQHSYLTLLYDTLTWHFLLDTLVRHSWKTLLWELL